MTFCINCNRVEDDGSDAWVTKCRKCSSDDLRLHSGNLLFLME